MDEAFAAVEAAFDLLESAELPHTLATGATDMNIAERAMKALDVLESSDTLHEFDDSVTLRVHRDLWEAFLGADDDCKRNGHRDDGRGACAECSEFI